MKWYVLHAGVVTGPHEQDVVLTGISNNLLDDTTIVARSLDDAFAKLALGAPEFAAALTAKQQERRAALVGCCERCAKRIDLADTYMSMDGLRSCRVCHSRDLLDGAERRVAEADSGGACPHCGGALLPDASLVRVHGVSVLRTFTCNQCGRQKSMIG